MNGLERDVARWYPLIDHPVQLALIKAVDNGIRFPLAPAGRRCLEKGTLVSTPNGGVPIDEIKAGDEVIGYEDGVAKVCKVSDVWNNGRQIVFPLQSSNGKILAATRNHKLWACNESDFDARKKVKGYDRVQISDLTKRFRVKRCYSDGLITGGSKKVEYAYVLGVLLGDGCSRNNKSTTGQYQKSIHISSENNIIPEKVASILWCDYRKAHKNNFTWSIDVGSGALDVVPFYREWCSGRYAHEKIADWSEIDSWDRESALSFLAGIIDTDGSTYYKNPKTKKEAVINISMQAKSVVDVCCNIVMKYFQEPLSVGIDRREKYVNGELYSAKTTSNVQYMRIISALKPYLAVKGKIDVSTLNMRNILEDRVGLKKGEPYFAETYDITVDNSTNLYCLHLGGIVTSNSGKTERFKRFLVKRATNLVGQYFAAAPTHDQAKKIFWDDLKLLSLSSTHEKKPSESNRIIYFPNGSEIHVIGLDKPQRIEGIPWKGGGIDEIADIKSDAWQANILPALNTVNPLDPDYRAWCWLLGVPDGLNYYYDLCQLAEAGENPDYKVFHWKSAEILPPDVIEAMKRSMSNKQFKQEFEASFETASGRIYEDYSKENQTNETIKPHEQLMWFHDFNFTPLSSGIGVRRGESMFLLDEIILTSAISRQSALEFVEKYKNHENRHVLIYGDPAGRAGEKHGHESDYTEMEGVLRENGWQFTRRVKKAAPAIKDRQNAVRAKIRNAAGEISLFVNSANAPYTHKGLATVQLKKGSTFQEEDSDTQHITTAIGYMIDFEYGIARGTATQTKLIGL